MIIWPNAATETLKKQLDFGIYGRFFSELRKLETKPRQAKSTSTELGLKAIFRPGCFWDDFIIQGNSL